MRKRVYIFVSILFALWIFIQHHYVTMCFDDYGYASLSYGWTENHAGMQYTLSDILKFLSWHYRNWGGRVLYFFFETVIFRLGGIEWMQRIQAVIVVMIGVISGKIAAAAGKCDKYESIALTLMLYGTFHVQTLRDGVYWYSASVSYVWPLLPLFGSMYLLLRIQDGQTVLRECAAAVLMFLAAFSQEQSAVAAVVWIFCMMFFQYFLGMWKENNKKYVPRYMVSIGISAVLGCMVTTLAPGNFVRAGDERYADFYSKSMMERAAVNIGKIIDINIGTYNWVFVLIMTVFCGTAAALYFQNRKILATDFLFTGYFLMEKICSIPLEIEIFVRIVWAVSFFPVLAVYYYKQRNYLFSAMLIAGLCSQGMMVLSPSISVRSHTMMEFMLHLITAECMVSAGRMLNGKRMRAFLYNVCMILTAVYSAWNFYTVFHGYKSNYEINAINHYKLVETEKKLKAGKTEKEVLLYKLYDDSYTNCMPYHTDFDFIEVWMKKYYELSDDIEFYWQDIEEDPDFRLISGSWYKDHWLGNGAEFFVQAEKDRILKLLVTSPQTIKNQQIQCKVAGKEKIYQFSAGETKMIELYIPAGRNRLDIIPSQTFIPDNGDQRVLSVVLEVMSEE